MFLIPTMDKALQFTLRVSFVFHVASTTANPRLAEGDGGADPAWQSAYSRARDLVSQMTIEEKVNMTNGHPGDCVGNTPSIERLGIPQFWYIPKLEALLGRS